MCEDVLVRANEYCRQSGIRFGQLIIDAVTEHLVRNNVGLGVHRDTHSLIKFTLFFMENEALEEALMTFVTEHTAHREAILQEARKAVATDLYFTEPAGRAEVDHGD